MTAYDVTTPSGLIQLRVAESEDEALADVAALVGCEKEDLEIRPSPNQVSDKEE